MTQPGGVVDESQWGWELTVRNVPGVDLPGRELVLAQRWLYLAPSAAAPTDVLLVDNDELSVHFNASQVESENSPFQTALRTFDGHLGPAAHSGQYAGLATDPRTFFDIALALDRTSMWLWSSSQEFQRMRQTLERAGTGFAGTAAGAFTDLIGLLTRALNSYYSHLNSQGVTTYADSVTESGNALQHFLTDLWNVYQQWRGLPEHTPLGAVTSVLREASVATSYRGQAELPEQTPYGPVDQSATWDAVEQAAKERWRQGLSFLDSGASTALAALMNQYRLTYDTLSPLVPIDHSRADVPNPHTSPDAQNTADPNGSHGVPDPDHSTSPTPDVQNLALDAGGGPESGSSTDSGGSGEAGASGGPENGSHNLSGLRTGPVFSPPLLTGPGGEAGSGSDAFDSLEDFFTPSVLTSAGADGVLDPTDHVNVVGRTAPPMTAVFALPLSIRRSGHTPDQQSLDPTLLTTDAGLLMLGRPIGQATREEERERSGEDDDAFGMLAGVEYDGVVGRAPSEGENPTAAPSEGEIPANPGDPSDSDEATGLLALRSDEVSTQALALTASSPAPDAFTVPADPTTDVTAGPVDEAVFDVPEGEGQESPDPTERVGRMATPGENVAAPDGPAGHVDSASIGDRFTGPTEPEQFDYRPLRGLDGPWQLEEPGYVPSETSEQRRPYPHGLMYPPYLGAGIGAGDGFGYQERERLAWEPQDPDSWGTGGGPSQAIGRTWDPEPHQTPGTPTTTAQRHGNDEPEPPGEGVLPTSTR